MESPDLAGVATFDLGAFDLGALSALVVEEAGVVLWVVVFFMEILLSMQNYPLMALLYYLTKKKLPQTNDGIRKACHAYVREI